MNDENFGLWITRTYASTRPDDDTMVQVKLRSGYAHPDARAAKEWNWNTYGASGDIVAYRVKLVKPAAEIQGHPHAALMAEYAKDAAVNPEPWRLWQFRGKGEPWETLTGSHPAWSERRQYRRQYRRITHQIPTEVVNGFVVPKALTEAPAEDTLYFTSAPTSDVWVRNWRWANDSTDRTALSRGLAYLTEEHAVAKAKAMCGVDPQWSQP